MGLESDWCRVLQGEVRAKEGGRLEHLGAQGAAAPPSERLAETLAQMRVQQRHARLHGAAARTVETPQVRPKRQIGQQGRVAKKARDRRHLPAAWVLRSAEIHPALALSVDISGIVRLC